MKNLKPITEVKLVEDDKRIAIISNQDNDIGTSEIYGNEDLIVFVYRGITVDYHPTLTKLLIKVKPNISLSREDILAIKDEVIGEEQEAVQLFSQAEVFSNGLYELYVMESPTPFQFSAAQVANLPKIKGYTIGEEKSESDTPEIEETDELEELSDGTEESSGDQEQDNEEDDQMSEAIEQFEDEVETEVSEEEADDDPDKKEPQISQEQENEELQTSVASEANKKYADEPNEDKSSEEGQNEQSEESEGETEEPVEDIIDEEKAENADLTETEEEITPDQALEEAEESDRLIEDKIEESDEVTTEQALYELQESEPAIKNGMFWFVDEGDLKHRTIPVELFEPIVEKFGDKRQEINSTEVDAWIEENLPKEVDEELENESSEEAQSIESQVESEKSDSETQADQSEASQEEADFMSKLKQNPMFKGLSNEIIKTMIGRSSPMGNQAKEAMDTMNIGFTLINIFNDEQLKTIREICENEEIEKLKNYLKSLRGEIKSEGFEWDYMYEKIAQMYDLKVPKKVFIIEQFKSPEDMQKFIADKGKVKQVYSQYPSSKYSVRVNKTKNQIEAVRK